MGSWVILLSFGGQRFCVQRYIYISIHTDIRQHWFVPCTRCSTISPLSIYMCTPNRSTTGVWKHVGRDTQEKAQLLAFVFTFTPRAGQRTGVQINSTPKCSLHSTFIRYTLNTARVVWCRIQLVLVLRTVRRNAHIFVSTGRHQSGSDTQTPDRMGREAIKALQSSKTEYTTIHLPSRKVQL